MVVRARIVLPITAPPIENGAVAISDNRIVGVGTWPEISASDGKCSVDLGAVVLLPGLVNSHCHLDYTDMSGLPPRRQFPDWIQGLLALKAAASYTDYAQAWLRGAGMLAATGTTTVGDIEAVPELLPDVWSSTPLRLVSFLEMTGVKSRRKPSEILREAADKINRLPGGRCSAGLSPHAPYSTSSLLLRQTATLARKRRWRVAMHVAESQDEYEMYMQQRGPLFDWLKNQRDMTDCGNGTPLKQVRQCGLLGNNFQAVHANYLDDADIAALAETGCSVAHCPQSHAYFGHAPFPYERLAAAGVNVCLGTDSLASTATPRRGKPELNMFAEMRAFSAAHPGVAPATILRMATRNGAVSLGLERRVGGISEGALADVIAIPFDGKPEEAPDAATHHCGPVRASMIDGEWIAGVMH